ncbi:MAG TPA: DNA polymerase [Planctomycetes bacterium]|nr:DNA polymerase [Planctomycetota bacterium]
MVTRRLLDRLWAEGAAGRSWCRVRRAVRPAAPERRGEPAPEQRAVPPPAGAEPSDSLEAIAAEAAACTRCRLGALRTHAVPGEGARFPRIVFVGEAPGEDEDRQGRPFVGRAGALLTRMIAAMGFSREQVFIANVLKCRPPGNRSPEPDEIAACKDYLRRQLALLAPEVIVPLGAHAARWMLGDTVTISRVRGRVHVYGAAKVVPTFHPSYLLRKPEEKGKAWEDLQTAMRLLGLR